MEKIFGIDLGTTNSEIAYLKDGKPVVVTMENGKKYLPSAVGIDTSGNIITGFKARNQYVAFPENTVLSIKRKMGSGKKVIMGGNKYGPEEISAEILKALKKAAEIETGMEVKKVVITVPAYFNNAQRNDTIKAGELAGLEVVRLLNEPTAAALAYGCGKDYGEKILVYDLGGGTFDVSLIDVEEDIIEVLATDGDSSLGGDDFDKALEEHFMSFLVEKSRELGEKEKSKNKKKNELYIQNLKLIARLKNIAEEAKIRLSTESRININEEFLAMVNNKPLHLDLSLSRAEFEDRIMDKLENTFSIVEDVVKTAKIKQGDIAKILLVGGSTHIPRIFQVLSEHMGYDVHREIDPTYCVAMGAAIQGAIIADEEIDTILVDVNAHSLGVRCLSLGSLGKINDNHYSIILHKNTAIPASMTGTYYTIHDNQRAVEIEAYQGEHPLATKNKLIGSFILKKLPKNLPMGSEVEVHFAYNLNGIVEITALEKQSGHKERLEVDINRLEEKVKEKEKKLAV